MPGLFISHSSKDKNFVRKLSIDLLKEGFPVWLDEWELEVGSSLTNKIYEGIDESTFFIVVVSTNSIESGWVKKELTGAMTKEEQLNRKFIIPIRLDDCQFPLSIADRLYSDFSNGYVSALEALISVLKRNKVHLIEISPEKTLIPLSFKRGIHLDAESLRKSIKNLVKKTPHGFELSEHQFVTSPDDEYQKLRQKHTQRMENIEKESDTSQSDLDYFTTEYRMILSLESFLLEGLALIINETVFKRQISLYDYADACKWYALMTRSSILYRMWSIQLRNSSDISTYGSDCVDTRTGSDPKLYSVSEMKKVYIIPREIEQGYSDDILTVYIDAAEYIHKDIKPDGYPVRTPLNSVGNQRIYSKYIVPQMVTQHFRGGNWKQDLTWDFKGFDVEPET